MSFLVNTGPTDQGRASAAAIAANLCVKWATTGAPSSVGPSDIVVCGVGDHPIGVTQDPIAIGQVGTFYRAPGQRLEVSGASINAGDLVKCGAAGVVVVETAPATRTLATVGQSPKASDTGGLVQVTFA